MIIQLEKDDCGRAVVKYLLMKFSNDKHYLCKGFKRKCDSLLSIKDELFSYGIVSTGMSITSIELHKIKKYSIVRIEEKEKGHFIVFLKRKKNKYCFYDPSRGVVWIKDTKTVKVSSALIVEKKEIKPLPKIRFLKVHEHITLALLSVFEAVMTVFSFGLLQHQQSFSIISFGIFLILILLHLLYLFKLERELSSRFMFPYFKKVMNYKDYKKLQEVKMDLIKVPSTVYSMISLTGVMIYLLLVIGLPYLISILVCGLSFFLIEYIVDKVIMKRSRRSEKYEDIFINGLKKKSFDIDSYNSSLKESKVVAWIMMIRHILKLTIAFIFAIATSILYKQVNLEYIVQLVITYFCLSLVFNRLLKSVTSLDFYHIKLSSLDSYAYELMLV